MLQMQFFANHRSPNRFVNIKPSGLLLLTEKSVWTPVIGDELYLEPEELSEHDEYAVAVRKDSENVGYMPHSFLLHFVVLFTKNAGV